MEYRNPWIYEGKSFTSLDINGHYGFVYLITNLLTGKMYIGRKYFWSKKRRSYVESNWMEYYGSSEYLSKDIEKFGVHNFSRTILSLHGSRGMVNYFEVKEQFKRNVLEEKNENGERMYYNGNILNRYFATTIESAQNMKNRLAWNKGKKTGVAPPNKGKKLGYKTFRITDGINERVLRKGQVIPEGWRKGRVRKCNNKPCTVYFSDREPERFESANDAKKKYAMKQSAFETMLLPVDDPKHIEYKKRRTKNKNIIRVEYHS